MITVDVQALTTLVGFAVFALAMLTYLANMKRDLTASINGVRNELRAEMRDGFARFDDRLTMLEQRTYDLSSRLPAAPTAP